MSNLARKKTPIAQAISASTLKNITKQTAPTIPINNLKEIAEQSIEQRKVFDNIRDEAYDSYTTGRDKIYESIAKAFLWYQTSKGDADYIKQCFTGLPVQMNSKVANKTVTFCLRLNPKKQASTISKYGKVITRLSQLFGNTMTEHSQENMDECIAKIKSYGGLAAFIKGDVADDPEVEPKTENESDAEVTTETDEKKEAKKNDTTTKVDSTDENELLAPDNTQEEETNFNEVMQEVRNDLAKVDAQLSIPMVSPLGNVEGDIIIMLARSSSEGFDVIHVIKNDELLIEIIKSDDEVISL